MWHKSRTTARKAAVRDFVIFTMGRLASAAPRATCRRSTVRAGVLRPGGFMSNALEWADTIRAGGHVLDPTGPGRFAMIDPADIAAVAALALTQDGHEDRAYTLTGDELGTVADHVSTLARELGRDIEVRTAATPEEAVAARFPRGAPPESAAALLEGFAIMRADTVGFRTDDVRRLLGREPQSFARWCARNGVAFR